MYTSTNAYKNQIINGQMSVWLQDYGWQAAKLGAEIVVGDFIMYNFGSKAEVVAILSETKATITVSVKSMSRNDFGTVYTQKISKKAYKPVEMK